MKNYYEILEVNEHASREVIEKAYRVLVKKYHPDLYKGEERQYAEQKVKDINEAYKVLSDGFFKSQYDIELQKIKNEESIRFQNRITENIVNGNSIDEEKAKSRIKFEWNNSDKDLKDSKQYVKKNEVGSIGSIVGLLKEIFKNKPKGIQLNKITKIDVVAVVLTILILIILGIILWFIPFTNGWMRQLIFENPLFSWIWALF